MSASDCKDTIPKIRNKYSRKRFCSATVPITTFMYWRPILCTLHGAVDFLKVLKIAVVGGGGGGV